MKRFRFMRRYRLKDGRIYWHKLYYDLMPRFMTDGSLPGGSYNRAYYLFHPHSYLKELYRQAKWFVQRGRRGYSDRDVWSLDWYLCSWMPEALAQLKRTTHGYPMGMSEKSWDKKLDGMIVAFKIARKIQNYEYRTAEESKLALRLFRKNFNLVKMYFFDLWD